MAVFYIEYDFIAKTMEHRHRSATIPGHDDSGRRPALRFREFAGQSRRPKITSRPARTGWRNIGTRLISAPLIQANRNRKISVMRSGDSPTGRLGAGNEGFDAACPALAAGRCCYRPGRRILPSCIAPGRPPARLAHRAGTRRTSRASCFSWSRA